MTNHKNVFLFIKQKYHTPKKDNKFMNPVFCLFKSVAFMQN